METVLVMGAGFLGSHTCKALAAHGFLPVAFDTCPEAMPILCAGARLLKATF
jgi:nucleoside-diphosphate-sugar epimerase